MNPFSAVRGLVLGAASLIVAGCCTLFQVYCPIDPLADACKASYMVQGYEFNLDGLKWPRTPTSDFTIGNLHFTPEQGRQLSSAAEALEQYRLFGCASLYTLREKPDATANQILVAISMFLTTMGDSRSGLKTAITASSAQEAVQGAEAAKAQVTQAKQNLAEKLMAPIPQPQTDPSAPAGKVDTPNFSALEVRIAKLESAKAPPRAVVMVNGFAAKIPTMSDAARQTLEASIRATLEQATDQQLIANVVGFADATGAYRANIKLGLQRAQTVAQFLRTNFDNMTVTSVTSGGIAKERHVEVVVWSAQKM